MFRNIVLVPGMLPMVLGGAGSSTKASTHGGVDPVVGPKMGLWNSVFGSGPSAMSIQDWNCSGGGMCATDCEGVCGSTPSIVGVPLGLGSMSAIHRLSTVPSSESTAVPMGNCSGSILEKLSPPSFEPEDPPERWFYCMIQLCTGLPPVISSITSFITAMSAFKSEISVR